MSNEKSVNLSTGAHIICGWPLVLVFIGGAIGGGLGGAAYAINVQIFKSGLPLIVKMMLNLVVGCAAIGAWLAVVAAIQSGDT